MVTTPTPRNTLHGIDINLNRLHHQTTWIPRIYTSHCSCGAVYHNGTLIGLPTEAKAKDVATVFLCEVWKLHGLPTEIISDLDAKFAREFWESLCKTLGIRRRMSTAYLPQTDGQTERTNQVLEGYLRNFVNHDQDDWYQLSRLALAEFAYNPSATNAHGLTPFYANYSFHPQAEWMMQREAQNPGPGFYSHWMTAVHEKAYKAFD